MFLENINGIIVAHKSNSVLQNDVIIINITFNGSHLSFFNPEKIKLSKVYSLFFNNKIVIVKKIRRQTVTT